MRRFTWPAVIMPILAAAAAGAAEWPQFHGPNRDSKSLDTGLLKRWPEGSPPTETALFGNVAYRTGQKLQRDAKNLKATDCLETDEFIRREYREGRRL